MSKSSQQRGLLDHIYMSELCKCRAQGCVSSCVQSSSRSGSSFRGPAEHLQVTPLMHLLADLSTCSSSSSWKSHMTSSWLLLFSSKDSSQPRLISRPWVPGSELTTLWNQFVCQTLVELCPLFVWNRLTVYLVVSQNQPLHQRSLTNAKVNVAFEGIIVSFTSHSDSGSSAEQWATERHDEPCFRATEQGREREEGGRREERGSRKERGEGQGRGGERGERWRVGGGGGQR